MSNHLNLQHAQSKLMLTFYKTIIIKEQPFQEILLTTITPVKVPSNSNLFIEYPI